MLIIATAISFAIGEEIDAAIIATIVILNAVVGFINEYRSEKALEAMKKLTAPKTRVLRDGSEVMIPSREIVPGDIVLFEAGDRVPADGRLLEVVDLKADEAVLTGESTDVTKDLRDDRKAGDQRRQGDAEEIMQDPPADPGVRRLAGR